MDTDNVSNELYISIITGHAIAIIFFMLTGVLTWGLFNKKIILYKLDNSLNRIGVTYDVRCETVFIAIVLGFIRITLHVIYFYIYGKHLSILGDFSKQDIFFLLSFIIANFDAMVLYITAFFQKDIQYYIARAVISALTFMVLGIVLVGGGMLLSSMLFGFFF